MRTSSIASSEREFSVVLCEASVLNVFLANFTTETPRTTELHRAIYLSLQMLADSPSHYLREPEVMEFLGPVPTVWDETRVLDAKMGEYVAIARRHGRDWYVGAMTDWTARELEIDFSFLSGGSYEIESYEDGVNANRLGNDYTKIKRQLDKSTKLRIKLAEGGGWAAQIHPKL